MQTAFHSLWSSFAHIIPIAFQCPHDQRLASSIASNLQEVKARDGTKVQRGEMTAQDHTAGRRQSWDKTDWCSNALTTNHMHPNTWAQFRASLNSQQTARAWGHLPSCLCVPLAPKLLPAFNPLTFFFFLILASFQFSQHLVNYSSMFSSTALSSLASASAVLSGGERRKDGGGERRQLWPLGAPVAGSALPHTGWGAGAICLNSLCFSLLHFKIRGMN